MRTIIDTVMLANGVSMPRLGLGTYKTAEGDVVVEAVRTALDAGYRLIDTASLYGNEHGISRAISESDVPREEIFVTTKVWNNEQGYKSTLKAIDESLDILRLVLVDHAEELDRAVVLLGPSLQHRMLGDTGLAPCGPEVDHHWLAAQIGQFHHLAVQTAQSEVGRNPADQRRIDRSGILAERQGEEDEERSDDQCSHNEHFPIHQVVASTVLALLAVATACLSPRMWKR